MGNNKSRKKYVSESPTNEQSRHYDDEKKKKKHYSKEELKNRIAELTSSLDTEIQLKRQAVFQHEHDTQSFQSQIRELSFRIHKGNQMLDEANKTAREKEKTIKELKENYWALQTKNDVEIRELEQKSEDLKRQNSSLLSRLSAIAGAKLIDGNANIADLSDENRPTKLSEQFSELYDNEWTDAFSYLGTVCKGKEPLVQSVGLLKDKQNQLSEDEICKILLAILTAIYEDRKKAAEWEMKQFMPSLQKYFGGHDPPLDMVKQLKDKRKKDLRGCTLPEINQALIAELQKLLPSTVDIKGEHIKEYVEKCFRLCRLMTVQDPPVFMETKSSQPGERFNGSLQKPYTQAGPYVDFVVWPTLYLCKDGNILSKGVVQCTSKSVKNDETVLETQNLTENPLKQQSDQSNSELKSVNRGTNNEVKDEKRQVLSEFGGLSAQKIHDKHTKTNDASMTAHIKQKNEKPVDKKRKAKSELSHSHYENVSTATFKLSATPNTSSVERTESLAGSGKRLVKTTIDVTS